MTAPASEAPLIEAKQATIGVSRKVAVRQYESLEVSIYYPAELPIRTDEDTDLSFQLATQLAISAAFFMAKSIVFEQAGVEYEDLNGVITEKVAGHFKGAAEVVPAKGHFKPVSIGDPSADAGLSPRSDQIPVAGHPVFGNCVECGGNQFWDNRENKKNPKGPDAKCKVQACAKAIWLKK